MTGNIALDLLIAAIAIAAITGLARFLFGADAIRLDAAAAQERLAFDEPDFKPTDWLVDAEGRAAAAVNTTGEIAIVRAIAGGAVTRRASSGQLNAGYDGALLLIQAADLGFAETRLMAASHEEALRWALRINGGSAI
ncbi:MAG: hypothetical protein AAGC77_12220 [Pseudomonadota bacterium]